LIAQGLEQPVPLVRRVDEKELLEFQRDGRFTQRPMERRPPVLRPCHAINERTLSRA
jgi:hypothetical protein